MTKKNILHSDQIGEWSPEVAEKLSKAFEKIDLKEITAEDSGTFKVIMTTEKRDRDGEIIKIDGWNFENFMKNPIVIYGHNYWGIENVIGRVDKIYREGQSWVAEGRFASEKANPKAQLVRRLYDEKILNAVSVGFIVRGRDPADESTITNAELLELSFVPIQSNPDAVNIIKALAGPEASALFKTKDTEIDPPADEPGADDTEVKALLTAMSAKIDENTEAIKALAEKKETDAETKLYAMKKMVQDANRGLSEALRGVKAE